MTTPAPRLTLTLLDGGFAICRLPADEPIPAWARRGALTSITLTVDELSIVCAADDVPDHVNADPGWRALQVAGPLPLDVPGVLAALAGPLADAGIPIFAVSTFDTDYLLVGSDRLDDTRAALGAAGHTLSPGTDDDPKGSL